MSKLSETEVRVREKIKRLGIVLRHKNVNLARLREALKAKETPKMPDSFMRGPCNEELISLDRGKTWHDPRFLGAELISLRNHIMAYRSSLDDALGHLKEMLTYTYHATYSEEYQKKKQAAIDFVRSRAANPSKALDERDKRKDDALRGARAWVKSSPHDDSCSWESNRSQSCDCGKVVAIERIAAALRTPGQPAGDKP